MIKEFPDKILLIKDDVIEDYWVLKNSTQCEDAEYIRKDTFVEKAIKYIANYFLAPGMDNEIKDFENYIKEE